MAQGAMLDLAHLCPCNTTRSLCGKVVRILLTVKILIRHSSSSLTVLWIRNFMILDTGALKMYIVICAVCCKTVFKRLCHIVLEFRSLLFWLICVLSITACATPLREVAVLANVSRKISYLRCRQYWILLNKSGNKNCNVLK